MTHERARGRLLTPATGALLALVVAGAAAAFFRFRAGLGAATNLSDQHPWGIWVGVDVLAGAALAAGGFITAALVHVFGASKYHALVRPAFLTGLVGYLFVAIGVLVDLALPWRLWHPIVFWPERSVMFEVAWCMSLYLAVVALEFAPAVFERFAWSRLHALWQRFTPAFSVVAIASLVGLVAHSLAWALVALAFFALLARALPKIDRAPAPVPILLVIAGVILSTLHQSSLGGLFLLMRHNLSPLWWTPLLPLHFLLSAVAVGMAMVIVEAAGSAKAFGRPVEKDALAGLGKLTACVLWIYLAVRVIDLALRGQLATAWGGGEGNLFLLELGLGVLLPGAMLASRRLRSKTGALVAAASLVVLGVVFNRLNVSWLGMAVAGKQPYFPSVLEILITLSMIAAMALAFTLAAKLLPVFAAPEAAGPELPRISEGAG